jgi:tRNA (guanosine-2'-O-)-methyltransferase
MDSQTDRELTYYLGSFITESKKQLMEQVLKNRTRFFTVVLEDIYQPHNASAVIRSCDCFGIQDLHIIENRNEYTLNPNVTQGSSKWVDIYRYNNAVESNTARCLDHLESKGYTIYATSSHKADVEVTSLEPKKKAALIFGTELSGLSRQVLDRAERVVKIPMYGFTESFNLSVSVALCLQPLINKLHQSNMEWGLTDEQQAAIRLKWYRRTVRNAEIHEKAFYESHTDK